MKKILSIQVLERRSFSLTVFTFKSIPHHTHTYARHYAVKGELHEQKKSKLLHNGDKKHKQ